jgi:hypothetical protein
MVTRLAPAPPTFKLPEVEAARLKWAPAGNPTWGIWLSSASGSYGKADMSVPKTLLLTIWTLWLARHRSRMAREATSTRGEKMYSMGRRAPVLSSTVAAMPDVNG